MLVSGAGKGAGCCDMNVGCCDGVGMDVATVSVGDGVGLSGEGNGGGDIGVCVSDNNFGIPTRTRSSAASLGTSSSAWWLGIGIFRLRRMASSLETMESRVTMEWS